MQGSAHLLHNILVKQGELFPLLFLIVFLYALIAAYVSGGGSLLMDLLPAIGDKDTITKSRCLYSRFSSVVLLSSARTV